MKAAGRQAYTKFLQTVRLGTCLLGKSFSSVLFVYCVKRMIRQQLIKRRALNNLLRVAILSSRHKTGVTSPLNIYWRNKGL